MAPTPIVDAMKSISKWSNLTKKNSERMTSNKGIDWHWMEAPHFGGVFEQNYNQISERGCKRNPRKCRCKQQRVTDDLYWHGEVDEFQTTNTIKQ